MNKTKKKIITIIFSSLFLVSIVGCNNTVITEPIKSTNAETGFFKQEVNKTYTISKTVYPNEVEKTKKDFANTYISKNADNQDIEMELQMIKENESIIDNRKVKVKSETQFPYDINIPEAEQKKEVVYYDDGLKPTNKVVNVDQQKKEKNDKAVKKKIKVKELQLVDNWHWRDGFNPSMKFKRYGSALYQIDETHFLKHNIDESVPDITGKEEALVNSMNLPTKSYKINSIKWVGKEFKKGNVIYRNAVATGQKYEAKYKAVYEQEIELPNAKAVQLTAIYTWRGIETDTSHVVMAVIAGVVLLAGLIASIITLLAKKKKKEKEENKTYND